MTDWAGIVTLSEQTTVNPPVRRDDLESLRNSINLPLPTAYKDFLKFSDGLELLSPVILSARQAIFKNQELRGEHWGELYLSFAGMFFFGEDADGDLFFFRILNNEVDEGVFVWRHEDDSRIRVSYTLEAFLEQYISGKYDAWSL
ncbi:hypothetical protein E5F05_15925 [Deinococcus metallilatus]|uniref:Knr4/Smi1-like domain-containing protein n=1 Tax=Deinococcus metallilatus TaxID=1211322 RepID=A0AAJ5F3M5_9DEIO|nr:SMI1/KNR4 family protein [Deinococcus metallilatus]MBB5295006.1 hypothetical protein [Deinococcus metallilatus]QBY09302.1 hypothetical protein E5F05_15925 [Deinococcus metallilatus]RXJ09307.1 hypothetical protein ERJ73_14760 [Deinococcus metallilatus]TLK28829.1 hypothetical protein FCS05_06525 [Deinococcus metallilatus]GMA16939.1 hypothetical protein GCM10025871_32700 [Deinococcus metallilatus]